MQIDDGLEVQRETSAIQKPGEVVGNQREMHVVLRRLLWAATRMSDKPSRCSCWRTWSERMFRN
jgi:hypothetical protein